MYCYNYYLHRKICLTKLNRLFIVLITCIVKFTFQLQKNLILRLETDGQMVRILLNIIVVLFLIFRRCNLGL